MYRGIENVCKELSSSSRRKTINAQLLNVYNDACKELPSSSSDGQRIAYGYRKLLKSLYEELNQQRLGFEVNVSKIGNGCERKKML